MWSKVSSPPFVLPPRMAVYKRATGGQRVVVAKGDFKAIKLYQLSTHLS